MVRKSTEKNIEIQESDSTEESTTLRIRPAKKVAQPKVVEIHDIHKVVVPVTIQGTSPLIVNNFNEKSLQEIEDQRSLDADQKRERKKADRPPVIPEERFQLARILDDKKRDCVHAYWIKASFVSACKYPDVSIASTKLRGAVFVLGDLLPIQFSGEKMKGEGPYGRPVMRRDTVRVGRFGNKQPDLRYRPMYENWSIDLEIEYEPALISLRELHHLIRRAGTSVGLCEWRPEKSPAGIFGRFDLKGVRQ